METFTVEKFAKELGLPVSLLLEQLKGAGAVSYTHLTLPTIYSV